MMKLVAPFISGLIFALGLGLSGMTDANKVIGFLDLAGTWDPSWHLSWSGPLAFTWSHIE